mgnify:CR=1 FL=1
MGGIRVDIAATVCSQHFDCDLRRHWALDNRLAIDLLVFHHRLTRRVEHRVTLLIHLCHLDGEWLGQS